MDYNLIKKILDVVRIVLLAILGVYSFLLAVGVRLAPYSSRLGLLLLGFVVVLAIPLVNKFLKKKVETVSVGMSQSKIGRIKK